jgi:hypothetical protein
MPHCAQTRLAVESILLKAKLVGGLYVKAAHAGEVDVLVSGLDLSSEASAPLEVTVNSRPAKISGAARDTETKQAVPVPPKFSDRPAIIEVDRLPFVLRFCRGTAARSGRRTPFMFKTSAHLRLENLALRQQLAVLRRSAPRRLKLTPADRMFWVWLRRVWGDWKSVLMIVKADTVVAWQRKGFRLFWTWKIHRGERGRPRVPQEVRNLIRMMSRNNPRWGAPRIHGEFAQAGP